MIFELFYSYGGHGGPYPSVQEAVETAERLIVGSKTLQSVEIRPYEMGAPGGFGKPVKIIHRADVEKQPELPELHKAMYLDYVNNFATVSAFATHYYISEAMATLIINEQRELAKVS